MRKAFLATAMAVSALGPAAHAAQDAGLSLHQSRNSTIRTSVGAQATVSVRLGVPSRRAMDDRVRVSLRAGPGLVRVGAHGQIEGSSRVAPFALVSVTPAHGATFSLAGQRVARMALTPEVGPPPRDGDRRHMSTGAKIAIGVGVVVLIGAGVLYNRLVEASD